jgi:hypothetical protein
MESENSGVHKVEEAFVALWCLVMPVTSLLVIPSIQGTTPAYIFAFFSIFLVLVRLKTQGLNRENGQYLQLLLIIAILWLGLLVASQLGHIIDNRRDFKGAYLVNNADNKILFRSTLFSQSLYFFACILIFLYFRYYFRERWIKYVLIGGYVMAAYGIYEWLFFLVFKHPGDFVANRMFGEDHPGSWSQTVSFGGLTFVRIKSFFGEPSFYTSAIIIYLITAIKYKRNWLIAMLAFNAIFSTSTSTYIALVVCLLFNVILTPRGRLPAFLGLVALICLVIAMSQIFPETFQGMFGDKISGDSESGRMRVESSMSTQELFSNFSVMNWLFGFGFGYAYNQVTLAIITNTGLIGFFIYCFAFLKPIWLLPREGVYGGYKTCIFGLFFLCNLTLSELFLPTTWMFLGLAYCKLDEYKRGRSVSSHGRELLETGGFQLGTRH